MAPGATVDVTPNFGRAVTLDMLRLVYCPNTLPPAEGTVLADTETVLKNLGLRPTPGQAPLPQIKDTQGIIAASRLCQEKPRDVVRARFGDPLRLVPGRELTIEGDTRLGEDAVHLGSLGSRCQDAPGARDALFPIRVDEPSLLYADGFTPGTNIFDNMIFLMRLPTAGAPPEDWQYLACADDSTCGGITNPERFVASQFVWSLAPGNYMLGVTGFGGLEGHFYLHLQTMPFSDFNTLQAPEPEGPEVLEEDILDRTDGSDVNNGQDSPRCQRKNPDGTLDSAPDQQFIMLSCPDFQGGLFMAHTMAPETDFDTVVALRQGNQARAGVGTFGTVHEPYLCNDDHNDEFLKFLFPGSELKSLLGRFVEIGPGAFIGEQKVDLSSGSGVRAYWVDGYRSTSKGQFKLHTSYPRAAAFRSGAFYPNGPGP